MPNTTGERAVEYTIEEYEGEPPVPQLGRHGSPIEAKLEEVQQREDLHGKWVSIGIYDKNTACSSAANVLRQRHGRTPAVEGWDFRSVRDKTKEKPDRTKLVVRYTPDQIVEGAKEGHEAAEKERLRKIEEARVIREQEKARKEAQAQPQEAQPQEAQHPHPTGNPPVDERPHATQRTEAGPGQRGNQRREPANS